MILHTNDVHGRAEALGRIAVLADRIRAEVRDATVVWLDAGDVEDQTNHLGTTTVPVGPLVRDLAAELRAAGADFVVLLSHLGLEADRALVAVEGHVELVVGAHSHHLLREGERGYADPGWGLAIEYDMPTILREAVEEHLVARRR